MKISHEISWIYRSHLRANSRAARTIFAKATEVSSPGIFVFYNGSDPYTKTAELKLSDAFLEKRSEISLELKVKVITINADVNSELLKHCETWQEYSLFVQKVRGKHKRDTERRFDTAITECIKSGILKEYLERKTKEALHLVKLAGFSRLRIKPS